MLIINTGSTKLEVKLNAPHGVDYVHLQPRGRVTLESGQTVDSNWKAQHGSSLKIVEDTPVSTAVASAVAARKVAHSQSAAPGVPSTSAEKE